MKRTLFFLYFLLTALLFSLPVQAGISRIWDSDQVPAVNSSRQADVAGIYLVWQAKGGLPDSTSGKTDWEIFLYNIELGLVTQITDDDQDDRDPKTDGQFVIWQKHDRKEGNTVYLYREGGPAGGEAVSTTGDNFDADIAGGYVVWNNQDVDQSYLPARVFLYNANNPSAAVVISNTQYNSDRVRLSKGQVVFQQEKDGTVAIMLYDLPTGPLHQAPAGFMWSEDPAVDGERRVFSRYKGNDREIFLLSKTTITALSDNTIDDFNPVITGSFVAWETADDILLSDVDYTPIPQPSATAAGISETGFTVSWSALPAGAQYFRLSVSTDPYFQSYIDGFMARDVGTATSYAIIGLTPGVTYYYRVTAVTPGQPATLSRTMATSLPDGSTPPPTPAPGGQPITGTYLLLLK